MQDFIDAENYDLSDFDPKAIEYFTVDGKLQAMPISLAVPMLFYNKVAFREVGLDPEKPPKDLMELKDMAREVREARLPWQPRRGPASPWTYPPGS